MRKIYVLIIISAIFCSAAAAQFFKDGSEHLYYLKDDVLKTSFDNGRIWYQHPVASGESSILENSAGAIYLLTRTGGQIMLSLSRDHGITFGPPIVSRSSNLIPGPFSARLIKDAVFLFFVKDRDLYCSYSIDLGETFSTPQALNNHLPVIDYTLSPDGSTIFFRSADKIFRVKYLDGWQLPEEYYTSQNKQEGFLALNNALLLLEKNINGNHQLLFKQDGIVNLLYEDPFPIADLKAETFECFSLSLLKGSDYSPYYIVYNGSFSQPKPVGQYTTPNAAFEQIVFLKDGPSALFSSNALPKIIKLADVAPTQPSVNILKKKNNGRLELKLSASDPDLDPISYKVDVSWDRYFDKSNTWSFTIFSNEAEVPLPIPDGKYFIRACASDHILTGPLSDVSDFLIDRSPPVITVTQPEPDTIVNTSSVNIQGTISEECLITVNSIPVQPIGLSFTQAVPLASGANRITLIATDEAGNTTSESFSLILNENAPALTLLKPHSSAWYKSGATILIEANVRDTSNNIADEADADVTIDDQIIPDKLIYSESDNDLSGFIRIPSDVSAGKHRFKVMLNDSSGNLGLCAGTFMIDRTPPMVSQKECSILQGQIIIPLKDEESGIDVNGTILKIKIASREVSGKVKAGNGQITFTPDQPLGLSSIEVVLTARDNVGNVGPETDFVLNYDGSSVKAASIDDSSAVRILAAQYGPNPFSPASGQKCLIRYSLSRPAELKFYIFSLNGAQLFSRTVTNTVNGDIIWNGKNDAGEALSSGVYLFAMVAQSDSGRSEVKRGKIILL